MFDIERHRRLTLRQRSALRPINVEFRVKPHKGGTRATVTVNLRRTYFRWLNIRTPMYLFVGRLMDGWRLAVAGGVPTPDSPRSLLAGPIDNVQEQSLEAQIQAPVDVIWELVEDVDGVGIPGGDDTHPDGDDSNQWSQPDGDGELFFVVVPSDDDRLLCSLSQIVRHSAFHVSVRGPAYETVHELIPGTGSHLLRITYRVEDRLTGAGDSVLTDRRAYVDGIKAAAEARGPRKVR